MITGLSFTLEQPTHIAARRNSDSFADTRDHLPGWTIRGAFAGAWIARHGAPSTSSRRKEFIELFEGGVRFAPAFVGNPPTSLAVVGHKYAASKDCDFSEYDLATARTPLVTACKSCRQPLETDRRARDTPITYRHTSVRIGADGVAQDGDLVTRTNIDAQTTMNGYLLGPDELIGRLLEFDLISVGGRRTTHGLTTVTAQPTVRQRPQIETRPDGSLVLRLASPAVLTDDEGRPTLQPAERELRDALDVPATVEKRWARWEQIGGWHVASGLPKHRELAVAAGSTYLVRPKSAPSPERVEQLARRGIGLRRHEGFGHLCGPSRLAWLPGRREATERMRQSPFWRDPELVVAARIWHGKGATKGGRQSARDRLGARRPEVAAWISAWTQTEVADVLRLLDEEDDQ